MGISTQGAGNYDCPGTGQSGAPPPFCFASQSSAKDELEGKSKQEQMECLRNQTDDDDIQLPVDIATALLEKGTTPEEINPVGFGLQMTKSGSILKSNFLDYIIHFIRHLPPGQGPGGKTVFLIMDYHGSCANPGAVEYARRHNVVILILPSKTSITSQPNDSSVNMVLATAISRNTKITNMCSTDQMTLIEFLMVLKDTWQEHVQNEASLLLEMRYNKATRGFVKTGLCPLDYDCENWKKAIRFFSSLARLEKQRAEADGLFVSDKTWTIKVREDAVPTTDSDIQILRDNLPVEYNKDDYHYLELGNLILHKLLDRYVNDLERNPDVPPQASNDAERIALRLLRFELASIRVDTTLPTMEGKQIQHERNILYSTEIHQPINLKDKE